MNDYILIFLFFILFRVFLANDMKIKKENMKKDSHSPFLDLNSKLQKRLDKLEEINYDICQCAQGFATLNSNILSFLDQLQQIVQDENNLLIQGKYINGKKDNRSELSFNYAQVFKTKDDFVMSFTQLSQNLADFISLFACKSLCDEFTTSRVQEIRKRFFKITEITKDINQIKFDSQNQIIPNNLSSSFVIKFHKIKTKPEVTSFIQKINDGSNYNTENLESLNKFYVSLEPIKDRLLEKLSSLKATLDDSQVYQKHPSPEMLSSYPEFNKYIKMHSKLKSAFDALFDKLRPYYVKIQRKQQQIDQLVNDLLSLSSKMDKTLKNLGDETNRYTNIECLFRKISVIDNSHESYQFFEPELYTSFILNFIDEEKSFLKKVDGYIKYSKSQTNETSLSSVSSASVVVNDNVDNRLSIVHQPQLLELFTNFDNLIVKCINRFEEKNIFNQLEDKLKKKKKLENDFPTKYPREDSSPKPSLLKERKIYDDKTKSINCAFEIINADIDNAISNLSKIETASSSFSGIHNFLKAEGTHFENLFLLPASCEWANQVADEFKLLIQNKKEEIEKVKMQIEVEKKKKDLAVVCCHQKTVCLASCGHTFCDSCLFHDANSHCPRCQKEFTQNDVIRIKW